MGRLAKRKCRWCPVLFSPNSRLKERQKSCGGDDCKRKQNLLGQKNWKEKNRGLFLENQKDWQQNHPGYWKDYRKKNKKYTDRNRVQSKGRWHLRKTLQKKLDILEVTENTMEYRQMIHFAKQTRSPDPLWLAYAGVHEFASCENQSQAT